MVFKEQNDANLSSVAPPSKEYNNDLNIVQSP